MGPVAVHASLAYIPTIPPRNPPSECQCVYELSPLDFLLILPLEILPIRPPGVQFHDVGTSISNADGKGLHMHPSTVTLIARSTPGISLFLLIYRMW